MNLRSFKLRSRITSFSIFFFVLSSNVLFGQIQGSSYTFEIINFLSPKFKLEPIREVDLKGSSVTTLLNFGQQFFVKKRVSLSKHFSYSMGGGIGYGLARLEYVSTSAFRGEELISRFDFNYWKISDEGYIMLSALGAIGYQSNMTKYGLIGIDVGIRPVYMINGFAKYSSGSNQLTGNPQFLAQLEYNSKNRIHASIDLHPYYLHRFKNSSFAIKGGIYFSFTPSGLITGEVSLFGDAEVFEAELKGNTSFAGLSVGVVYIPRTAHEKSEDFLTTEKKRN